MASLGKTCASCGGQYGPEVLFCPLDGTPLGSGRTLANSPSEIDPYLDIELAGQIKLNALVGIGSMGRVYRAFQAGVDRDVAVKILHRELTGNQELVGRFHREAKIASRLVHPNVVQVLMTGTIPKGSDARVGGEVYLVIEYLDGISLLSALAAQGEGGALPLARTLHIILQMCHAVGEAHLQGIIHRDLKPENIMLVRRAEDPDFVKVLDFGIARLDSTKEGHSTQAGLIFGTAKYISPEGAEGKHVGPQADVYAIATMLYQCLSGRAPFEGDSPVALLVQQINATPPELHSHPRAGYVPEPIARLVMGNLAKNPADRSADARAFARELTLAARDAGLHLDSMQGGAPRGDLRLMSKQRTRQHEFSPELKAQIAAMPPSSQRHDADAHSMRASGATSNGRPRPVTQFDDSPGFAGETQGRPVPPGPPPPSYPPLRSSHPDPTEVGVRASSAPGIAGSTRPARTEIGETNPVAQVRVSRPGLTELPDDVVAASVTQLPDDTITGSLEHENGRISVRDLRELGALEKPGPTIQGSPLDDVPAPRSSGPGFPQPGFSQPGFSQPGFSQPGMSQPGASPSQPGVAPPSSPPSSLPAMLHPEEGQRRGRFVALMVAVLVLVPVGAFAAVKLFANHGAEADPIAVLLEQAQEALEKRAWDAPPGANVKELSDRMLNESPGDRRVLGLRRAAADGILTDALSLRDSGRADEALRLAKLALTFAPDLAPAQKLVGEIERAESPNVDASLRPDIDTAGTASSSSARPRPAGKPGAPGTGKPVPSGKATASGEPGLAPPTPPDPTPPTPGSSRPWL